MKINIKPNLRQFLTDKMKTQKKNFQNIPLSNQNNNLINQINSHTNSNKNIGKFSLLNSIKDKDNMKLINEKTNNNEKNLNYNFNNNSLLKENENDYNKFRKSKTSEKINGNKLNEQQENKNIKNKKVVIKQNFGKMKKYNLSINKIPKYDNSAFNQVIKYYTIKSESKTIQIEELSTYLRPIRNILGFANKIKKQNNKNSSININSNYNKKYIINNSNKNNYEEKNEDKKTINNEKDDIIENNNNEEQNKEANDNIDKEDDKNELIFTKKINVQSAINLNNNDNIINQNDNNENNNINNQLNKINIPLIKNCVFNNISHTQRNIKFSPTPFKIKIDKINNINLNYIKNFNSSKSNNIFENNKEINTTNNINNINSKNDSEIDTQISTNNNINHNKPLESQVLNQFRPRKMNLPKSGINLSSLVFNNKLLQNILNKRKQNK